MSRSPGDWTLFGNLGLGQATGPNTTHRAAAWPVLGLLAILMFVACAAPSQPSPAATSQPADQSTQKAPVTPLEQIEALNRLAPEERKSRLLEEARKEGTVVWYGSYALPEAEPWINTFNGAYPQIKVEYVRANSQQLADKILSEYQAGKHLVDVITIDHETFQDLKKVGAVSRYCSPERQAVSEQFKDKDCEWTAVYHNPKVIAFNTRKFSKDQAPKSWEDLLDPRWKGQLGMPADDGPKWIVTMENILGKEKAQEYLRRMAEQRVQLHQSHTTLAQLIAAGQVDAGFHINIPAVTNTQKQGGPIASISPDPLPTAINSVLMAGKPQHPFAAAVLIDYILSRDGQRRMAEISTRLGPRTDVTYPDQEVLQGVKLLMVTPEMLSGPGYEQAKRQFTDLFAQR